MASNGKMTILNTVAYVCAGTGISIAAVVAVCLVDHFSRVKPRIRKAKEIASNHGLSSHKPGDEPLQISKQGFSTGKMDELESNGPWDAIVVGTGISGLTVAALLSRRGWRVLCLEQHDVAGGCTHEFNEKGFNFDTGVHYIGGRVGDKKSMCGFLFDLLSLGHVKWNHYGHIFDRATLTKTLNTENSSNNKEDSIVMEYPGDPKEFEENLLKLFPHEAKNIKEYMRLLQWSSLVPVVLMSFKVLPLMVTKRLRRYLKTWLAPFLSMTADEVISAITSNKVLAGCLTWCYGDYGLTPSQGAFLMNSMITNHYIDGGAYYPIGGPACISDGIIPTIEASGGKVLVRAKVSKFLLSEDGNSVIGVSVRGRDVYSKTVISAAGVLNTYMHMLPSSNKLVDKVKAITRVEPTLRYSTEFGRFLEPSCAMFSVFIGVDGSPSDLGLVSSNIWTFPNWDHKANWEKYCASVERIRSYIAEFKDDDKFDPEKAADYYFPLLFVSSSTAKDVQHSNIQGTSIELLTVVDHNAFLELDKRGISGKPGHRGQRYESTKTAVERRLVRALKEFYPQITDDKIKHISSGTPLSSNFFLGTNYGEVYGLSHNCNRFNEEFDWLLRPKQPIKGLYLTGQDVFTDGLAGALLGGILTAISLDWTVFPDLMTSYAVDYV